MFNVLMGRQACKQPANTAKLIKQQAGCPEKKGFLLTGAATEFPQMTQDLERLKGSVGQLGT